MEVLFLNKTVKIPDEYYWGDMKRVLEYLKLTKHIKLTFRVDSLLAVNWWIYVSYNTHDAFRDHIGCMMRLGKGAVLSWYLK